MSKSYEAAKMATDFQADLITEATAKRVLEFAASDGVASLRGAVMAIIAKPNRDQLADVLLKNPEMFAGAELAAKTYMAHLQQMMEFTEYAAGRLAAARSYVETLQGKLNKPADGAA